MTEQVAHRHAEALAHGMGITFYVVRTREGTLYRCNSRQRTAKSSRQSSHPTASGKVGNLIAIE